MSNTTQTRYVRILPSAVESKYGWNKNKIGLIYAVKAVADKTDLVAVGTLTLSDGRSIYSIEPEHTKEVYVYDEPRVLPAAEAQPKCARCSDTGHVLGMAWHGPIASAQKVKCPDCSHTAQPTEKNSNKYDKAFEELNQNLEKPMRVRVVKAKDSRMWYAKKIGHMYDVLAVAFGHYIVDYAGEENTTYYIAKSDCEVVTEQFCRHHQNGTDRITELEKRVAQLEGQHQRDSQQPSTQQESNFDKARRIYPKGTRFKCPLDNAECKSKGEFEEDPDGDIWVNGSNGFAYYNRQWAEVVQPIAGPVGEDESQLNAAQR